MHTSNRFRQFICAKLVFLVAVAPGCGWAEADAVPVDRHSEDSKATVDDTGSSSDAEARTLDSTEHPFKAEFEFKEPGRDSEEGDEEPGESEDVSPDLCTEVCLNATWCRDQEIDDDEMGRCIDSCEFVLDENFVDDEAVECIVEADNCGETRECYGGFQACDDVCQWHENCDGHDSRGECTRWCGGEIWSGELRWDAYGCLIDTVEDACPAFGLCGVSVPGE